MTERQHLYTFVLCLSMLVGLGLWLSDRHASDLPAAHEATQQAIAHAEKTDTVYLERKAEATAARVVYRTIRDSALRDLRDTALTKRAFAQADTAFVHDTITIVAADTVRAADKTVKDRQAAEIVVAMNRPPSRLAVTLAGLYEPLTGTPAASAEASFRLVRSLGLIARADQRFAIGEKVRASIGFTVRL